MRPLPRPRHVLGSFAAGLCLLPLLLACGGRSDTEDYLFGSDGSGATGTGASSSTGASSNTGARPGDDDPGDGANGSGANGSGASGGASSVGGKATGGTRPVGGGTDGGGTDVGGTGQGGSGVAGSPSGPPVSCGDTTCDSSQQSCCAGFGGFGCIPKGQQCTGAVLTCSDSDDCPGNTVCCLRVIEAEVGSSSECKAACLGMGPTRERQLCQSNAECASNHCRPTVFGVSVCTRL